MTNSWDWWGGLKGDRSPYNAVWRAFPTKNGLLAARNMGLANLPLHLRSHRTGELSRQPEPARYNFLMEKAVTKAPLHSPPGDLDYRLPQPVEQRFAPLEMLRQPAHADRRGAEQKIQIVGSVRKLKQ